MSCHPSIPPHPWWTAALATIHLESWQRLSTRHQPGTLHHISPNPPTFTYTSLPTLLPHQKHTGHNSPPSIIHFTQPGLFFEPLGPQCFQLQDSLPSELGQTSLLLPRAPPRPLPPQTPPICLHLLHLFQVQ